MDYKEFTTTLNLQISSMPGKRQLSLAIKICKELFFDYQKFFEIHQWGNPDLLLDGIIACEKTLGNDIRDIAAISELISQIDPIIPDTEDFSDASYALNAGAAVIDTLHFLLDNDPSHINDITSYYTDTIDFRIQEDNSLAIEEIDSHPEMITARQFLLSETRS